MQIKTTKLDLAGQIISESTQNGANSVDQITFGLNDPQPSRAKAIIGAAHNAIQEANQLAKAANLKLLRVLEISLEKANEPPTPRFRAVSFAAMNPETNTPITSGQVDISATVNITYEIETFANAE